MSSKQQLELVLRASTLVYEILANSPRIWRFLRCKTRCQAESRAQMTESACSSVVDHRRACALRGRKDGRTSPVTCPARLCWARARLITPVLTRVAHTPISPCTASSFAFHRSAASPLSIASPLPLPHMRSTAPPPSPSRLELHHVPLHCLDILAKSIEPR